MANARSGFWRDSARSPRFFFVDALAAFPMLLFLLHIRWWTFYLAIASVLFFAILERFNFTVPVFIRWSRTLISGNFRVAKPVWRE